MRKSSARSRGTLERIGYLLAVLCLNAWLGGCSPQDGSSTGSGLAKDAGRPTNQMAEILGHLLVALCLVGFLGGCCPRESSGGSSGGEGPQLDRLHGTDSDSGIGSWSDAQIALAIREGIDDAGQPLIPTRPYFREVSDAQMTAIIANLRSGKAPAHDPLGRAGDPPADRSRDAAV